MTAQCVTAARKFDNATRKTLLEEALNVANAVTDEWEDMTDIQAAELAEEVVADYPKGSKKVRKSEWKSFFMAAHHNLADALEHIEENSIDFSRVKLFKLCRVLPTVRGFKGTIKTATTTQQGGGKKATLEMGLGVIRNAETSKHLSKAKLNEFRRKLKELCEEYDVKW